MNILGTQYSLKHKSLDIYLAGCAGPHCSGCHNPESWDYDNGTDYKLLIPSIIEKVKDNMVQKVFILGGEPLDQNEDELVDLLDKISGKEMWLFTRKELVEVPNKIKRFFAYIKSGRYDESLKTTSYYSYGIQLASFNQKVTKHSLQSTIKDYHYGKLFQVLSV